MDRTERIAALNDPLRRDHSYGKVVLVRDGDKVLVTDAWHPGILQLAYMRDLHR